MAELRSEYEAGVVKVKEWADLVTAVQPQTDAPSLEDAWAQIQRFDAFRSGAAKEQMQLAQGLLAKYDTIQMSGKTHQRKAYQPPAGVLTGPGLKAFIKEVTRAGVHQKGRDLRGGAQQRLGRRLEEVAEAVGGGYCRLQMPLRPALGVRGTVAGHRLGALGGGGGGTCPPVTQGVPAPPSHRGYLPPPFQCIPRSRRRSGSSRGSCGSTTRRRRRRRSRSTWSWWRSWTRSWRASSRRPRRWPGPTWTTRGTSWQP